ncbi:hypothetical protein [Pararhodobacter sp.]|uniref:hypothetical protein n=1 Tax=Pararhodobacter sp. TaxID=2127056 RepID=UPI002FE0BC96
MTLRRLHRLNALLLGLFLALHLANHAALLAGQAAHSGVMAALRPLYRNPLVEPLLIALFAAQIALGLTLAWRRGRPVGGWALAQLASGLYLAFFLLQHLPAVLLARPATDTDIAFAAATVESLPKALYFAPYYVLAVAALATHLAAALRFARWPAPPGRLARTLPWIGAAFGLVILAGLLGVFG